MPELAKDVPFHVAMSKYMFLNFAPHGHLTLYELGMLSRGHGLVHKSGQKWVTSKFDWS